MEEKENWGKLKMDEETNKEEKDKAANDDESGNVKMHKR